MGLKLDYSIVLISDGNSEHVTHARMKIGLFKEEKIQFVTSFDLIECLKHIKKNAPSVHTFF